MMSPLLLEPPPKWRGRLPSRAARYGLVWAPNLDEASGTRVDSFAGLNLTDNNTVTGATGPDGGGASQFAVANSEYLSRADAPSLSAGDFDQWWSVWTKLDSKATLRTVWAQWNDTGPNYSYLIWWNNSGFWQVQARRIAGVSSVINSTAGNPAIGTWYHLFIHHDAVNDTLTLSVNDQATPDSVACAGGIRDATSDIVIGANSNPSFYMDGAICMAAMGKSPPGGIAALAAEIRTYLYNGGQGRRYPAGWT